MTPWHHKISSILHVSDRKKRGIELDVIFIFSDFPYSVWCCVTLVNFHGRVYLNESA